MLKRFSSTITTFGSQIDKSVAALKSKLLSLNAIHRLENSKLKDLIQITQTKQKASIFVIDESKVQFVKKEILKMGIDSELKNKELVLKPLKIQDGSVGKIAESFKIDIRNKRMETRNALKKQGLLKDNEATVQKMTDDAIKAIDQLAKSNQ